MSALAAIRLPGEPAPWLALGLALTSPPSTIGIGAVACEFDPDPTPGPSRPGAPSLGVIDLDRDVDVDGVRFFGAEARDRTDAAAHPCRASVIDHVVVMTSSLERTCDAVERSLAVPLKRVREVGGGVRQGFHRLGEVILEVVETPQHEGPARVWGLVIVVDDLAAWAAGLGPELVAPPKPAVQPGRSISNVRAAAGLGLPVAFMTPGRRSG